MFYFEISTGQLERMAAKWQIVPAHGVDIFRRPAIIGWV